MTEISLDIAVGVEYIAPRLRAVLPEEVLVMRAFLVSWTGAESQLGHLGVRTVRVIMLISVDLSDVAAASAAQR